MLGKVAFFPLIRLFSLRSKSHLPPREGFWSAASDEAMRRASVPSPMRGRWRGAPDEVVDVNERPLIRLFSLRSKSHPLQHSRIGAWRKKPSRLAFSYASRSTGGEKAFGSALPSNAPRKRWLPLGEAVTQRYSRIGARLKKPSRLAFFLRLAPPERRLLVGRFPNGKALGMPLLFRDRRIDPYSSLPPEKVPFPSKKS